MTARAIRRRWPIDDKMKQEVVEALSGVMKNPGSSPKEKIAAAKGLLSAEGQNQQDEHKVLDGSVKARDDQLAAIAADLGIDPALIVDGSVAASGGVTGIEGSTDSDGEGKGRSQEERETE